MNRRRVSLKDWITAEVLFVLVGFGLLAGGVYTVLDNKRFLAQAHAVSGVVVDRSVARPRIGERGATVSAPVVEYRDSNGDLRRYYPQTRDSY